MSKLDIKDKLSTAICTSSFFILTIFLFTPLNIYLTNLNNFNFYTNAWALLFNSLAISALFVCFNASILILLKASTFKNLVSILFTASFLFWFFSNILVWDYGLFYGIPINWDDFNYRAIIDSAIYILFLMLLIFKKDLIYKISKKASIALIIIQLISVLLLATQKKQEDFLNNSSQKIDFSQQFNFSKNKNIIILVIDSFQTDFFQEIINKDNSYKKMFNGFTYFRNAAGGFPATAFSTPLILTSKYYDNSQPKKIFLKKAFLSDSSISKILKKNGFLADIYPSNLFYYNNETISNYKEYNKTKNVKLLFNKDILFDYIQLFDITLFRICPHFFKKNIYANRSWFLKRILTLKKINRLLSKHNQENDFENNIINEKPNLFSENSLNDVNVKFIQEMHLKAAADYDKPAFKYYHLAGIHPPIYLDENLKHHYNALPATRESYITNAKGILKLTGIFIDILKRNKIYDNSMIFIIADHGTQHIPVDLKPIGFKETNTTSQIDTFNLGSGLPLILVKPFNSQTNFEISDAPVSLANIGATIFDALHITEAEQIEKSMFKIGKEDKIYRRFLHHNWGREEQNSDYMPKITEYTISGFSWLRSSWKLKKKK